MTGWAQWSDWGAVADTAVVDAVDESVNADMSPALETDRYCPRCDTVKHWSNRHDHGLRLACEECGYMIGAPLTDQEQERAEAYEASPVRRRPLRYRFI